MYYTQRQTKSAKESGTHNRSPSTFTLFHMSKKKFRPLTYDIVNFGCRDKRFTALMAHSGLGLAIPCFEFLARVHVEETFQTANVILDDGEILVLY